MERQREQAVEEDFEEPSEMLLEVPKEEDLEAESFDKDGFDFPTDSGCTTSWATTGSRIDPSFAFVAADKASNNRRCPCCCLLNDESSGGVWSYGTIADGPQDGGSHPIRVDDDNNND